MTGDPVRVPATYVRTSERGEERQDPEKTQPQLLDKIRQIQEDINTIMDPQSLNNLDPKLRETYERVMGGAASAARAAVPDQNTSEDTNLPDNPPPPSSFQVPQGPELTPKPSDTLAVSPDDNDQQPIQTQPEQPQQSTEQPEPKATFSTPLSQQNQQINTPQPTGPVNLPDLNNVPNLSENKNANNQAHEAQETSPVLKILYIFGGTVFFLIYIFLWAKIFKLPIPFLSF